jgi:hypothetical protein
MEVAVPSHFDLQSSGYLLVFPRPASPTSEKAKGRRSRFDYMPNLHVSFMVRYLGMGSFVTFPVVVHRKGNFAEKFHTVTALSRFCTCKPLQDTRDDGLIMSVQ